MTDNYKKGLISTISAFSIWGLAVIFWKQIRHVDSFEILAHRIIWSFVLILIIFFVSNKYKFAQTKKITSKLKYLFLTAILLCCNWLTFIWAVNAGHVVECSLGYFINPLVNVLLGWLFFNEQLNKSQIMALCFAILGVLVLTISYGHLPWIAFVLAGSFGLYGMLRKKINIASIPGFGTEMLFVFPLALGYLLYLNSQDGLNFLHVDLLTNFLIIATGLVTAIPLLLFNNGVRWLPLKTVGFIQYITPSGMFILGIFIYHEPFSPVKLVSFVLIWIALAIYSIDNYRRLRQRKHK